MAKHKRVSNTEFNLNMDVAMEMEKTIKGKRDKQTAEKYYNDNISRNAVGKLFDGYVREEEKQEPAEEALDDESEESEDPVISGYDEDAGSDFEEAATGNFAKDIPRRDFLRNEESTPEPTYMDYISSMSRAYQTERLKGLEQPESIKQYTQRQEIIRDKSITNSEKYRTRSKRIEQIEDYADEEYEEAYEPYRDQPFAWRGLFGNSKAALAVGGFVIIVIFSFLVFKINDMNHQLTLANETIAANENVIEDHQSLRIENDDLRQQIRTLEDEIALLATTASGDGTAPEDSLANPEAPPGEPADESPASGAGSTYIVQSGDTFWSIAVDAYGDGNRSTEIMSYNNITTETDLKIGAELRLP